MARLQKLSLQRLRAGEIGIILWASGEISIHARLRFLWPQGCAGAIPVSPTKANRRLAITKNQETNIKEHQLPRNPTSLYRATRGKQ